MLKRIGNEGRIIAVGAVIRKIDDREHRRLHVLDGAARERRNRRSAQSWRSPIERGRHPIERQPAVAEKRPQFEGVGGPHGPEQTKPGLRIRREGFVHRRSIAGLWPQGSRTEDRCCRQSGNPKFVLFAVFVAAIARKAARSIAYSARNFICME